MALSSATRADDSANEIGERRLDTLETRDTRAALVKHAKHVRRSPRITGDRTFDDTPSARFVRTPNDVMDHAEIFEAGERAMVSVGGQDAVAVFPESRGEFRCWT